MVVLPYDETGTRSGSPTLRLTACWCVALITLSKKGWSDKNKKWRLKSDQDLIFKGRYARLFFSKSAFSIHALMLILTETRQLLHFQPIAGQKITGVGSWGWKKRGGDRQSSLTWNILPCKFVFQYLPLPFDDLTTQELNARKPSA